METFKIKNNTPGFVAITLENSAITLAPGQAFDLALVSSLEFIRNSEEIKRLLKTKMIVPSKVGNVKDVAVARDYAIDVKRSPETFNLEKEKPAPKLTKEDISLKRLTGFTRAYIENLPHPSVRNLASALDITNQHRKRVDIIEEIVALAKKMYP